MMTKKVVVVLALLVLLFGACAPAATPAPTATPRAVATPTSTATPLPGAPATPTPVPAATPTRAPTPAAGPYYGGTFKFPQKASVPTWDTINFSGAFQSNVTGFIYDRLQRYNPGPPQCQFLPRVPSAVESWKWVNDTTFEMKVRQGMRFHNKPPVNGREATAQDLIFTVMEAGKRPGLTFADVPLAVERAEATDRYTVRLYLKFPYAVLPDRLPQDAAYFYAPDAVGEDMALARPEEHIGTGPFMFKEDRPGVSVILEKNPNYWMKGLPYVDKIDFKVMPDASTRAATFRSGQVDIAWRESIPLMEPLEKMPEVTVHKCGDLLSNYLATNPTRPPLDNVLLRRAVAMAIDREAVVQLVYRGNGLPLWAPSPHFAEPGYMQKEDYPPETRKYLEYNPAEARKLLVQAGYDKGITIPLNFRPAIVDDRAIAEAVNAMLAKVGIDAKLVSWVDPAWTSVRVREEMEGLHMLLGFGFPASFQFYRRYHSATEGAGVMRHGIKDKVIDELSEKLIRTRDPKEQEALLKQLQIRFVDQAYAVAWAQKPALIMHPWVKNLYFQPLSLLSGAVDFLWPVQLAK